MNPREFHALASELASAKQPAKIRSAISRAYYSAFHVGLQTLERLGFAVGKGGAAHGEVVHCFKNSSDAEIMRMADRLRDLHTARLRADYQLSRIDVEQFANALGAVDDARAIITAFERILTSPNHAQVQTAIAAWRKNNGYP